MEDDSPRALVLRALVVAWGMRPEAVAALCDGSRFAPEPLSEREREGLARRLPDDAPAHVRGDYPAWLADTFRQVFGPGAAVQGAALAARAPVDLRVNSLKADRGKVLKALARFGCGADAVRTERRARCTARGTRTQSPCRGGSRTRQRLVRGARRGLASGGFTHRRCAKAASYRPLRRGRRQDAGLGGADGKHRSALRVRCGPYSLSPNLRAAEAGRCAERANPPGRGPREPDAAPRQDGLRGDRCALHRDRACGGGGPTPNGVSHPKCWRSGSPNRLWSSIRGRSL